MVRVYRRLLYLYPAACRLEFGQEMAYVFACRRDEVRDRESVLDSGTFYVREFLGLVAGASSAHLCSLFGLDHWASFRRFDMRPGFKFPRSTVFLMCVILAGVVLAIEKAKDITLQYGPPHVMAVGVPLPSFLLFVLAAPAVMVAAVWAILFALHRTGLHRLSAIQTWTDR